MADGATRSDTTDHAKPGAVADARTITFPYRPKRPKQFYAVPADPKIRSLHHSTGFHVRAGNEPASASVDRNDSLRSVTKIGDVLKCKSSRGSRWKSQRLRQIGPDDVYEEHAGTGFRRLVYR